MKKLFFKKAGESLVEVIVAIFVVSIGSSVATTLIISALQANTFSRDSLIALNLATEGLEAMRNIRDSNWLRFSYDKAACWNTSPGVPDCPSPNNTNAIDEGTYSIDLQPTDFSYQLTDLTKIAGKMDLQDPQANNNYFQLSYLDLDSNNVDSDSDGKFDNDHDFYFSNPTNNTPVSPFYRMIQVDYPTDTKTFDPANPGIPADQSMTVTSTVQWQTQGIVHRVVLQTILSNYQKIKAL